MNTSENLSQQPAARSRSVGDRLLRDGAIAVLLWVLFVLGARSVSRLLPDYDGPAVAMQAIVAALVTLPLTARRLAPRTVMFAVTIAFLVCQLLGVPEGTITVFALFLAIYTVGAHLPPSQSRWARVVVVGGMFLLIAWDIANPTLDSAGAPLAGFDQTVFTVFSVLLNLAFFAAAWVIGDLVWRHRQNEHALAVHATELATSRELLARRAVQEERVRIARELHDVVAHHVSVMGIQAGAARRVVERDPSRATTALTSVEQASRDAIAELQRLLGFLHDDEEDGDWDGAGGPPRPQPTLADLDTLVRAVRDVGLAVDVDLRGRCRPLPDTVELAAYRIIQEALTNTLRHAQGASTATVRLTYTDDRLHLSVRDDGTASSRTSPDAAGGRGLVGMHERAALHDGELVATSQPGGGFAVEGWLPLTKAGR